MSVIFISGPMSGYPDFNKPAFMEAENYFHGIGVENVLNPASLPSGLADEKYLPIDMAMIDACDIVMALDGWEQSRGAVAEVAYAVRQGKYVWGWCQGHRNTHTIVGSAQVLADNLLQSVTRVGETEIPKSTTTTSSTIVFNPFEDDTEQFEGITWVELLRLYAKYKRDITYTYPWDDFGYAIAMRVEDYFGLNEDE